MIKFKYVYPAGFVRDFKTNFVLSRCVTTANNVLRDLRESNTEEADIYENFLSRNFILSLVFCKPKNLKSKIDEVYEIYPIVADRYSPSWIFNQYRFNFDLINLDLRTPANISSLMDYKVNLLAELERIVAEKGSILASYYKEIVTLADTPKKIRNILARIRNICNGTSKFLKAIEDHYPEWFNELENIFDYKTLRTNYGVSIISSSSLDICPYCNVREIEIVQGVHTTASPDIDHFYPKSRYPFLATTLSNFVPSCGYCNQKFKRDKDTFNGHMHPLIQGTRNYRVFKFFPPILDGDPIISLDGSDQFKKNISMFGLESVYKNPLFLKEYKRIEDLLDSLVGLAGGFNNVRQKKNIIQNSFFIGDEYTVFNNSKHKFRLDIFSHLTGLNYKN